MMRLKNIPTNMIIKRVTFIILVLLSVIVTFKYYQYRKSLNSLKNFYEGGLGVVSDIDSFFYYEFKETGNLPNKKIVESFLKELDSDFLRSPDQYFLNIDEAKRFVKLYCFGITNNNNHLKNKIDARLYKRFDGNYKQNFTFLNYLLYGDYDILLFEGSF